jgi:triacylglycerol lipase
MVAQIQRVVVVTLVILILLSALAQPDAQRLSVAVMASACAPIGLIIVLTVQMLASAVISRQSPIERPTALQWMRAWFMECAAAVRVFAWQQPFRTRSKKDNLANVRLNTRGIVLVHGYFCNRALWNPWLRDLQTLGIPCIAITLEPAFGSIDAYADLLDDAVTCLEQCTGHKPIIVAHSMGGLATRSWMAQRRAADRVHRVITIGTPHQGTWLARFASTPNGRQMRRNSEWIQGLRTEEQESISRRFICYYSHCDNIVFPTETAMLAGADNRHVPATGHVQLAFVPEVFETACMLARA